MYIHPGQNEHWFVSTAHTEDDISKTVEAVHDALRAVKWSGLPPMKDLILVVDVGTSRIKVALFSTSGQKIALE